MKRLRSLFCLLALGGSLLFAVDRKSLFLDNMNGFEVYIERAIAKAELGSTIDVIEEEEHPDLKAMLGKRFSSMYAEALYRKNTGRAEDTRITLVDVKTKKELLVYDFTMTGDDKSKQRSADEFVNRLKKLLLNNGQ
jgi:hypothetical protein